MVPVTAGTDATKCAGISAAELLAIMKGWTRNVVCGLGILVGSYVTAAFSNASPITQPSLAGGPSWHSPVVPTAPNPEAEPSDVGPIPAQTPQNQRRTFEAVARGGLQAI